MSKSIWQQCLQRLEDELSAQQFNTCIKPLQVVAEGKAIRLLAPNKYIKDQINDQFIGRIRELVMIKENMDVSLEVGSAGREENNAFVEREAFYPLLDLNKEFTFDSFVEGRSNQIARAAALQVAENIGGASYNPLLLYGGVGLGKTHLMHAVGNSILERNPHLNVAYMYSQRFMEDMVRAIEHGTMADFTQYYRAVDVLLMDDIQFLAKGMKSQEEFFHTFNDIYDSQRQIFLTSDRPAGEIDKIESRLLSRFQWGLVADIQAPDWETRVAILTRKADAMGISIEPEIIEFLAKSIARNVRRMEGALTRVAGYVGLTRKKADLETVQRLLRDILREENLSRITIESIQN